MNFLLFAWSVYNILISCVCCSNEDDNDRMKRDYNTRQLISTGEMNVNQEKEKITNACNNHNYGGYNHNLTYLCPEDDTIQHSKTPINNTNMLKDYSVHKSSSHEYSDLLDYQDLENYVLGGLTTNDMKCSPETSMCTDRSNDYIDETLNTYRMANASLLSEIQSDWWSNGIDIWSANLPETFATDIDDGPSTSNNFGYSGEKTNCTILGHETNTTKHHVSGLLTAGDSKQSAKKCGVTQETQKPSKIQRFDNEQSREMAMKEIEVNDEEGEFYPNAKDESETNGCIATRKHAGSEIVLKTVNFYSTSVVTQDFLHVWLDDLELVFRSLAFSKIFSMSNSLRYKLLAYQIIKSELMDQLAIPLENIANILKCNACLQFCSLRKLKILDHNVFLAFIPPTQRPTTTHEFRSPKIRWINIPGNEPEWRFKNLPKILKKLKSIKGMATKYIISKILIMVSEEELDPCLIFPFQHTTDSKVSYDISFFMDALKRLFEPICLFYNYEVPLCLKLSNEQVHGLAKHFWQILMEEDKRLVLQFIPELFSLRKELDSKPGTFYPCKLYQIITIIYSTSNLHHILKCIDKYKWYDRNENNVLNNLKVVSTILFMREILMVPLLISFCCHPYVLCLYIWLFRLENHFLITNDYLYFNDTGAQDNPFSIVFFYFFSVAHFYQLPEQLLRLGGTYNIKTIDYLISQLATFCIRYFKSYNVLKEFDCLQFINPLLYDQVKNYFVDKSYIRLYKTLNNVINFLKCQSSGDIEHFLQSMTFHTNVA